ncbi:helix-hairpin-helix domain-containing protein [Streptomyces sp. NPDC052682]|uniref:helix-hairpin-helix domain-containing protein n=1 Tax=Streptomyces sp. NPDC052682 TaxID=3154954 RepID=UPI003436F0CD
MEETRFGERAGGPAAGFGEGAGSTAVCFGEGAGSTAAGFGEGAGGTAVGSGERAGLTEAGLGEGAGGAGAGFGEGPGGTAVGFDERGRTTEGGFGERAGLTEAGCEVGVRRRGVGLGERSEWAGEAPGRSPAGGWGLPGDEARFPAASPLEPERAEAAPDGDAGATRTGPGDGESPAWTKGRVGPALRERMPVWLQARCGLERRSVLALTVVLVLAAVFAVQHFWAGRTQPVRPPEMVRAAPPYGERKPDGRSPETVGPGTAAGAAQPTGTAGPEIVVDVGGKVREPGIHRLPPGSRVADALRAAGGVRPGTNTDGLNRARFLVDGEQIVVGSPAPASGTGPGGAAAAGTAGMGAGGGPAAPVSLNTATVEQLDTLPGVGPVLAQHIIDYRTQHGGFRSVDELREVNGIGDRRFADLRNLVRP